MKKARLFIGTVLMSILLPFCAEAQGMLVFDNANLMQNISKWMTAIDTLYANYDMVMNTITQIENQYKTIQQAMERAKGIDWENIRFDGDFDIRNDIKNANKRINKLLTQANTIKGALTTNVINAGGASYSLADLCGMGKDENKDVFTAAADVFGYMSANMKAAKDAAIKDITPEAAAAIMSKYGISAGNYWFCVQMENQMKTAATNAIANIQNIVDEMEANEAENSEDVFVKAALEQLDSDGNPTEGAVNQANMMLLRRLSQQTSDMKKLMREAIGLSATKIMSDVAEKEASAATSQENAALNEYQESSMPSRFITGAKSLN